MADYIYLLENRLSPAQRSALRTVRELARSKSLTVFLVGGAVRDLTSGSPVRDLDVAVQGNALKLKADLEKVGATITGEFTAAQSLFAAFPGSVRIEIGSTLSVTWPKPGKPVYKPSSILDDLRRRDFTANAMALSLNEGSYGLLMDPLNGIADIENRELRLVSNYGFIEDPIRMVRAARLMARLGWALDEKTLGRYETGKQENYIAALTEQQRGYELEEIVHEEDPLRVITRLESEGWLQLLAPFWTAAKADVTALEHLREVQTQLQMQGIHPDPSAANFPLLTAKLSPKDVVALKSSFVRQGFVKEIDSVEQRAKELANLLNSKAAALPSQTWQILTSASPEAVLWVAYSSKSPAIQAKFKNFFTVWPLARQKVPYALMQEMRIVPELPIYDELLGKLFFELMDDKLQTPEELKAFLEPYSPPAPPPPVSTRRPRASKKEAKGKGRARKAAAVDLDDDAEGEGDGELPDEIDTVSADPLDESSDSEDYPVKSESDDESDELDIASGDDKKEGEPARAESALRAAPKSAKAVAKTEGKAPSKETPAPTVPSKRAPAKPVAKAVPAPAKPLAKAVAPKTASAKAELSKKSVAKSVPPGKPSRASIPAPASRPPLVKTKTAKIAPAPKAPTKKPAAKTSTKPVAQTPKKGVAKGPAGSAPPAKTAVKKALPASHKLAAKKVALKKSVPASVAPKKQSLPAKAASKKAAPIKKRR